MYDKRRFNKINDKKVLHKIKKQWVTISLALLMMIGGGAVATHVSASANANVQTKPTKVASTNQTVHKIRNQIDVPMVNGSAVKSIRNVNKLKNHQSGDFNHRVYERVNAPFNTIRINHPIYMHSSVDLNHSRNIGTLYKGNVVKIARSFKEYGYKENYLRYEIHLMDKRNAFISGDSNAISYVTPSKNYKYYRNKLNQLFKHTGSKVATKFRKEFKVLNHRHSHRSNKYLKLYELVYGAKQNVRVNYRNHVAKINNYNRKEVNHDNKVSPNNSTVNIGINSPRSVNSSSYSVPASSVADEANIASSASTTVNPDKQFSSSAFTPVVVPSMDSKESSEESQINSMNSYYAKSGAKSADQSIANSYKASVSASVDVANQAKAKSAASVADQKIESSIANSYAKSTENTNFYKNSLSIADSSVANSAAQVADNNLDSSIASSYANSADRNIAHSVAASVAVANSSVAQSAQQSADRSVANSYEASVSNSVSIMNNSIASSAASSADQSIANSVSASAKSQAAINTMLADMKSQVFSDVNNDRKNNGRPLLQLDSRMDKIASIRAKQLARKFSHYDNNGNTYYMKDAQELGINLNSYSGENIGEENPGYLSQSVGNDIANTLDDGMMNHDAASNWGHRKNILNANYTSIGIGVYYYNGTFYLSEDFESNN